MRPIGGENDDPLKRIQQEINEVKQRELELRNQLQKQQAVGGEQQNSDDSGISTTSSSPVNGTSANHRSRDLEPRSSTRPAQFIDRPAAAEQPEKTLAKKKPPTIVPNYVRSTSAAAFVFAPRNPKPSLPVEYYLKAHHVKPKSSFKKNTNSNSNINNMLTRTVSTPQLFQSFQPKQPARGFMQRFIEARGKMSSSAPKAKAVIDHGPVAPNASIFISPTAVVAPPVRDSDGKPLRKGFVPVEEKIQKELREMRHREVELKIQRQKSGQYDSNNNLEDDDSEHYNSLEYEGNLRTAKSIDELDTRGRSPSPSYRNHNDNNSRKLRPALSLAQLCDVDQEEVVCPNRLIAQFECMIQNNTSVVM